MTQKKGAKKKEKKEEKQLREKKRGIRKIIKETVGKRNDAWEEKEEGGGEKGVKRRDRRK